MFGTSNNGLLTNIMLLVPWILSLSVHEWAHAWSAHKLGDDTAERQGRLTLNPIAHIDLFGTIIAPLLNFPIAWAKPVPVNPLRFRRDVNMKTGMMITAVAGPISNLVLAMLLAVVAGLLIRFNLLPPGKSGISEFITQAILLNISLMVFNFLPIPPLDGSRIVERFVPYSMRGAWEQVQRFGFIALLLLVWFGSGILRGPMLAVGRFISFIINAVAGT